MQKFRRFVGKGIIFLCVLCVCLKVTYQIIIPKLCYDEMLPTTLAYIDFYDMEKDTIDVLFLGSSLAATAYVPQELYDRYGICSYNLASEKQSPIVSYFWLKEALRYQSPKVLVLDCYYFFQVNDSTLNTSEISIRRALDYMRWSSVKLEAIWTICELDPEQSISSYFFPNIRYHERWGELAENDFTLYEMADGYGLKGYAPLQEKCGFDAYTSYESEKNGEDVAMPGLMEAYMDKICKLCEQEGISLILTNVPLANADEGRFYALQDYAQKHELAFYDFNEEGLYEASGFDFPADSYDCVHTNVWGAEKLTACLGGILNDQYAVGGRIDEQWERTRGSYKNARKDCELIHITDLDAYIEALQDDRYSVFISAQGNYAVGLKDATVQKLRETGLKVELQKDTAKEDFYCYYAVISEGQVEEYIGYEKKVYSGSLRNGLETYDISGSSSIVIGGKECSVQRNGLNIVVYHNEKKKVLDSVCFDTSMGENLVSR